MNQLLEQINQTFENCMENSSEETKIQLKILKGNINTLFQEYEAKMGPKEEKKEPSGQRPVVLIVDDSSIVRNYLTKQLEDTYEILVAENGEEAIAKLDNQEKMDVMLLDLMMPNIDGFGVLDHMASQNIQLPVIVISGDSTKETINKAFEYHVEDVIVKPFDSESIKSKIHRVIG